MIEDWKWGPNFNHNGMVCGFGAFKKHVSLIFFKGALLKDPKMMLEAGGSKIHIRIVKLSSVTDINRTVLTGFVKEAVRNNIKGLKIEVPKNRTVKVPRILQQALNKNKKAKETFNEFPYSHKREYVEWINEAKRPETLKRRINQTIEKLLAGESKEQKYQK